MLSYCTSQGLLKKFKFAEIGFMDQKLLTIHGLQRFSNSKFVHVSKVKKKTLILKCSTHSIDLNDYKFVEFGQADEKLLNFRDYA